MKLLALAVFFGPLVATFAMAPVEALGAWRVWILTLAPAAFVLIAGTVFRAYVPLVDAPLRLSAGAWAKKTLGRLHLIGITVAAVDRAERGRGNYFHPASKTIVLDENVHGEHTARAYATAAHEIGHAVFHNDHPLLSRVLLAARGAADGYYFYGVGLLFGTAIAGEPRLRVLAFAIVALAVVLHALVVVDEVIASSIARDLLRDDLGDADQGRIARGHLRRALATYVSVLVAYLVPLAVAPWILDGTSGVIPPGEPLAGAAAVFAHLGAWVVIACAIVALLVLVSPWRDAAFIAGVLLLLVTICWAPFFATLVCDQTSVPRWTVALATVPAWSVLVTPLLMSIRWFAAQLAPDVDMMPMPMSDSLQRVSRGSLGSKHLELRFLGRVSILVHALWIVPLAIAWLVA